LTKARFLDDTTINILARDGETFTLKTYLPVVENKQQAIANFLSDSFEKNFSDDKSTMVYFVFCDAQANAGFSFSYAGSDRSNERKRIGARIRQLREDKGMEAKQLAKLVKIDAANLSRIEQGRYSVGLDILTKIADALGVKVDLV
jgi:DNA-binding XRE family transcriptional regulator